MAFLGFYLLYFCTCFLFSFYYIYIYVLWEVYIYFDHIQTFSPNTPTTVSIPTRLWAAFPLLKVSLCFLNLGCVHLPLDHGRTMNNSQLLRIANSSWASGGILCPALHSGICSCLGVHRSYTCCHSPASSCLCSAASRDSASVESFMLLHSFCHLFCNVLESSKCCAWDSRNGRVAKNTDCSCRRSKFSYQHLCQAAQNCFYLQHQEIWSLS